MSPPESIASLLASRLATLHYDDLSAAAKRVAVTGIIDTVGVTLLGATEPVVTVLQKALAGDMTEGKALVLGSRRRSGALEAALINGTASHAADYDDMAAAMGGHPSVTLVPVLFALGETLGASGTDVLESYVVGFEAECRIGHVVMPDHYTRGWHPTSTLGVFGAAAAAARLLKLGPDGMTAALTIAASLASGLKANFGTMTKPLHVGQCARNGLMAARLAAAGFTSNPSALEHKQGFFASYDGLQNVHVERLMAHWGERLEIEDESVGIKQFPCCGSTHPAVRAMLTLRDQGLREGDVASIHIKCHRRRLPHTDNPNPTSPLGAKFSLQYAAVRALIDGPPRLKHFESDAFLEPSARALLAKTSVAAYPDRHEATHGQESDEMAADVTVVKRDGTELHVHAPHALGRGGNDPLSNAEQWEKYSDCATRLISTSRAEASFAALRSLERCTNLNEITTLFEVDAGERTA